ncbi:MAG: tetratricopeptide repeat protein [Treponema sp.]|jgi:tetratricopeptide (TPR) repeat protein|nr:tetratricopeptide repeat protein [Treponema sp.]
MIVPFQVPRFFRLFSGLAVLAALAALPVFPQAPGSPGAGPSGALQNYRTGRDLEARDRMREAEPYYNEAVRICTDEISRNMATRDSYTVLTWTLQRQRKYADVIVWGERGLRLFADEYRIVETMGEAYFYLDDYNSSLRFMQRYVNSLPQGERASVAYFFIGEIYRLQRKFRHADIAISTAVQLAPEVPLWWYRLGTVREAAGDSGPAVAAYRQALRISPAYREAQDGLNRLQPPQPPAAP